MEVSASSLGNSRGTISFTATHLQAHTFHRLLLSARMAWESVMFPLSAGMTPQAGWSKGVLSQEPGMQLLQGRSPLKILGGSFSPLLASAGSWQSLNLCVCCFKIPPSLASIITWLSLSLSPRVPAPCREGHQSLDFKPIVTQ